jgi:Cu(I)/Ag(I) efflux system membrane protein CusA/SilA
MQETNAVISRTIYWSIENRLLVVLIAVLVFSAGIYAMRTTPLDAIPDLSDVQVIIRTNYAGQAPQVVEDQITYPLSTAMLSVPGATSVRGYSFFGDSYIYVIFSDDTDIYWARSRVQEYLDQVSGELPRGVKPKLGPDATGVGWVYQYALIDKSGKHDLADLRSLQDWFLKYELQTVPGVSEVATVGGMVKQYQIAIDPDRLRGYYLTLANVKSAIEGSNEEMGGSALEISEAEYMVRFKGYVKDTNDLAQTSVPTLRRRLSISSVLLDDIARSIQIGPAMRRGVADLDGEGEVVGGIIVMRHGANALETINHVKGKLNELKASLPDGVELVTTYDRSTLINNTINTLSHRLLEEFIVVVLVCAIFLLHMRSSLVILISLPVGILAAFLIMRIQGVNANIMSLGGIAIAIGAMVDATIVMIENVHKHANGEELDSDRRVSIITKAATDVGKPLFYSLLIITVSFLPVFALEAQEARLFAPLAYTKTYAMAAAAGISITLVPVLMVYLIRGRTFREEQNPINRFLIAIYKPILDVSLRRPWLTLSAAMLLLLSSILPFMESGSEFMPDMNEGDLLYMPTTLPGLSIGKGRELLQQTNRLIKKVPEVERVFGKIGRAETATDPAPLTMIESVIQLKPQSEWREGMDIEGIKKALDETVRIPGLTNAWLMPIRTRIDMQSTGINTPIGIKIAGPELDVIQTLGEQVETVLKQLPETQTVLSDRSFGGRYIDVDIDRYAAGHYGLSINEIEEAANIAIGGMNVSYTVEGRERYPINLRYPHEWRNSVAKIKQLPLVVTEDTQIQLQDLAEVRIVDGPPLIKSENGRLTGWVYITSNDRDLGGYVSKARRYLEQKIDLPAGYTMTWSGQYQYLERAKQRLSYIIPFTLFLIFIFLYLGFGSLHESFMVMLTAPLSLIGGIWLVWMLEFNLSVAVAVGFIALMGVASEFGVVMLIYIREAMQRRQPVNEEMLREAITEGAVKRVRPKAMTAAVIIIGLMPIMLGSGASSEVMQRIAAPIIGGMITAPMVSMLVIPVVYFLFQRASLFQSQDYAGERGV